MKTNQNFSKKFASLVMIFSLLLVCLGPKSILYAKNKKHKKEQKIKSEKLELQYQNLKQDYSNTMESFTSLLQRMVAVYDELEDRIYEIEQRNHKYEQELFLVREVFNKKAQEDETFRVGFDLPFWGNPVYIDGVRVERHPRGENSNDLYVE